MLTDAELFSRLPSRQTGILSRAIGRRLQDIERLFILEVEEFLAGGRYRREDYFVHNSGPTQFSFEGDLIHSFAVWGEQLSIVLLPGPLQETPYDLLYRLSQSADVPSRFRDCLGQVCLDVRLWTFMEDFESAEALEAAVSYRFEDGQEIFYVIYLHGEDDNDYLLTGDQVSRQRVARCYSLRVGKDVAPYR